MAETEFVCPRTRVPLAISADNLFLESPGGEHYAIVDGIAELLVDGKPRQPTTPSNEYYASRAQEYDIGMAAMFSMLCADEIATRNQMIEMLKLTPGARVLEIGCGTCRDTVHLLERGAIVYAGDLSREMMRVGQERLRQSNADFSKIRLFLADVMRLPFPDRFFDMAFHFGGLNFFPDVGAALSEMSRVVKLGGRVVVGDEGMGSWLSNTEFAQTLEDANPLFRHNVPLDKIPVHARDVTCRWILGGSFYLIAFEIGEGEPQLNLDTQFPGWRGGSRRSRHFGKLEGVSPDLQDMVTKAAASEGVSIVAWLETALRRALEKESAE